GYCFLTTSAFTIYDYTIIGGTNQLNLLQNSPELRTVAKYILPAYCVIFRRGSRLIFFVFICFFLGRCRGNSLGLGFIFQCFSYGKNYFIGEKRFCNIVVSPEFHYFHSYFYITVPRNYYNRNTWKSFFNFNKHCFPIHTVEAKIAQNQIKILFFYYFKSSFRGVRFRY